MTKLKILLLLVFIITTVLTYGQNEKAAKILLDTTNITFGDSIFNMVVDSIFNNLGQIVPTNDNNRLVKHFKYIGTVPIFITRVWTEDPHFICEYPKEQLIPHKIYSFTVCFCHQDRQGNMTKIMGFDLSDGNKISFKFKGTYIPTIKQDK